MTTHVWTIEVGGEERTWSKITFTRSLDSSPTKFSATLKYVSDIDYFDVVEIKNNDTTEWYGYVEKKTIEWDGSKRVLEISGRCRKLLLWKKWTERFTDTRLEGGFFGSVSAEELIKFLVLCPVSDDPVDENGDPVKNHKVGWGIAPENITVLASPTVAGCKDDTVIMRYAGIVWRNRGEDYNAAILDVTSWDGGCSPAWDKTGDSPYLQQASGEPEDSHKISHDDSVTCCDDFSFDNLPAAATGINKVEIFFYLKTTNDAGLSSDGYLEIWKESTEQWVNIGSWSGRTSGSYEPTTVNISAHLLTVADVNAARVRFWNTDEDGNGLVTHITVAYLIVDYQTSGSQEVGDYFMISLDESTDVVGILVESRQNSDRYARNYSIQYSNDANPDPTDDNDWTDFEDWEGNGISVTGNTFRDILHSWGPETVKHIRIKITVQEASYSWEISQIYVYKAEAIKYRVHLYGQEAPENGYAGGPYLANVDFSFDDNFDTSVEGTNLPFGRLIDAIETVVKKLHSSYIPFEWWIALSNGALTFEDHKGTDKSSTISFVKGTNLGGTTYEGDVSKTVQRVKFIGKSEGKKQDDVSSDWETDTDEMANVNSFYEEVISKKTISSKDVAELHAKIHLNENAPPEELITCNISNDPYDPLDYDVGDDVTITDSLTGITGAHRIHGIKKVIDDDGEHITLYVGTTWKDVRDEWARIYKKLRELSLTGTAIEDWFAEGSSQNKLNDEEVAAQSFEKSAQNDEEDGGNDKTDGKWHLTGDGVNGKTFTLGDEWMSMVGTTTEGSQETLTGYIAKDDDASPSEFIKFSQNPKIVLDFKIYNDDVGGDASRTWSDGDYLNFLIGHYVGGTLRGFGLRIHKSDGAYKLYGIVKEGAIMDTVLAMHIKENTRYRFEAVMDWENESVKFYFQDPDGSNELELFAIIPVTTNNYSFYPLYFQFVTEKVVNAAQAKIYIYKYRAQWEVKQ